jgi:hypothetical protein
MLRQCPMTGERRDVSNRQVSNRQNADKRLGRLTTGKCLTRMSSDLVTSYVASRLRADMTNMTDFP